MMNRYGKKERRALLIFGVVFILTAAIISVGGYAYYRNFERQFRAQAELQLSVVAELKANELVNWREEHLADANFIYKNHAFSSLTANYLNNPQDVEALQRLRDWLGAYYSNKHYDYDDARLLNAQGETALSFPAQNSPLSSFVAQKIPAVLQSKEIAFIDFYRDERDQRVRLGLLIPILDEQTSRRAVGLVFLRIDPQKYLYPYIQRWPISISSSSAETLLIRREGNAVLFLNEVNLQKNTELNLRIPLDKTEVLAVKAALGQAGIVEGADYRGVAVIGAVRVVPNSPWALVAKMDAAEVYAPLRERLWETAVFFSMLIAAVGMGLLTLWRRQRIRFYRAQLESAEALRFSELDLKQAQSVAHIGSWKWDIKNKGIIWSDEMYRLFGIDKTSYTGRLGDVVANVAHPNDLHLVLPSNIHALTKKRPIEYRIILPNQSIRYIWEKAGEAVVDNEGNPIFLTGVAQDVTERKQAEEALQASEERYRAVAQSANDAIVSANSAGNIVSWNRAAERMFGYAETEIYGQPLTLLMSPRYRDDHVNGMERVRLGGDKHAIGSTVEVEGLRKDGSEFALELSLSEWEIASGKFYTAIIRDVAERKRAEDALKTAEANYRAIFEKAPIGIFQYTPDGHFSNINPALARMFGYASPQEMMAKITNIGHRIYVNPPDKQEFQHALAEGDGFYEFISKNYRKNAHLIWTHTVVRAEKDAHGNVLYYEGFITDITARKRADAARAHEG